MGALPEPRSEIAEGGQDAPSARLRGALSAPLSWASAAVTITGLLAWLAVTNHWMSWGAALRHVHANDEPAYLVIARAFPGFPGERIANQHAQRWPVHWLIGGIADVTGLTPQEVYRWVTIALVIGVCCVLAALLIRLRASVATGVIALGVVALNTYALRYYGLAPGYLADLVFDLGLGVALLGLVTRRLGLVLLGLVAGAAARQTMLPVVLVAAGWIAFLPDWRALPGSRWGRAAVTLILPIVASVAIVGAADGFSRPGPPFMRLTIFEAVADLPSTASGLANHFAHWAIGLVAITALLGATLTWTRLRGLGPVSWGSFAVGAVVVGQAALLNPDPIYNDYWSTNEPRLVAIGLVPLAVALAAARGVAERSGARRLGSAPGTVALLVVLLALASLHHVYTAVSTGSKQATLAIVALSGLGMLVALMRSDRTAA